eukprot:4886838-Amphidinium_carterae.1
MALLLLRLSLHRRIPPSPMLRSGVRMTSSAQHSLELPRSQARAGGALDKLQVPKNQRTPPSQ